MSNTDKAILCAVLRGYFVAVDGTLFYRDREKAVEYGNNGYKKFTMRDDRGKTASIPVHRLAAYQKFGKRLFDEGMMVRHLNGNCLDNSYDNMAIGTASDNRMDIPKHIRLRSAKIAAGYLSKSVIAGGIEFESYREAGRYLGISDNGVRKRISLGWDGYEKKVI